MERLAFKAWAWVACRPKLYALGTRIGVRYLNWLAAGRDRIRVLGVAPEWTRGRDFPAPEGKTFRDLYAQGKR
jgi:L-lactate dehydrogenase complex protein LldF